MLLEQFLEKRVNISATHINTVLKV